MIPYPNRFPRLSLAAIAAELAREQNLRRSVYARLVERGRMARRDADHGQAVAIAWRMDLERLQRALAPLAAGKPALDPGTLEPGHTITWRDRREGLIEELAMRAQVYPREIERARLTQADAAHQVHCLEAMAAFYDDGLDWPQDPADRAALYDRVMARHFPQPQQELAL